MEMDQRAAYYLKALTDDSDVPGGVAFRTALRQSRLDASVASLERVDHLLDQIRLRVKPTYEAFVEPKANQNFLFALVFYVGAVVSRHAQLPLRWMDYDGLIAAFPTAAEAYPRCLTTAVTCVLGSNIIFVPLSPILERLFEAQPGQGVSASAHQYIGAHRALLAFREAGAPQADGARPPLLQGRAMQLAGYIAAQRLQVVARGIVPLPAFGAGLPDGQTAVAELTADATSGATSEDLVAAGLRRLDGNEDQAPLSALVYAAEVPRPNGAGDALVIEVRSHAEPAFAMSLLLPYRAPDAARGTGFAVGALALMAATADDALLPGLIDCFYLGVHEDAEAADAWRRHLDDAV